MPRLVYRLRAVLCILLLYWFNQSIAEAQLPPATLEQLKHATVFIKVESARGKGSGSGFFFKEDLIVTNAHVLLAEDPWQNETVTLDVVYASGMKDQRSVRCEVAGIDVPRDIAFLRVLDRIKAPIISPVVSNQLIETTPIHVLGFPLGSRLDLKKSDPALTISSGQISSLRKNSNQTLEEIQVNATLIPGCSGGPVVDSQGKLVGISRATVMGTKLGFIIPADQIEEDLQGRISSFAFAQKADQPEIRVRAAVIDPQHRIQKTAAYYWLATPNSQRPVVPGTHIETHGAASDGPRQYVELQFSSQDNHWVGAINVPPVPDDRELWIQFAVAEGKQVRLSAAVNYSREYRNKHAKLAEALSALKSPQLKQFDERLKNARNVPGPKSKLTPNRFAQRASTDQSQSIVNLQSSAIRMQLSDKPILDIVAPPQGHCFYVTFENEPQIFVYDTRDLKLKTKIDVARMPESMACWQDKLVVACTESRIIQFIDPDTQEPVHAVRIPDRELFPSRILGEAPDGSVMTLWHRRNSQSTQELYLVDPQRPPLKMIEGDIAWCTMLPGTNLLFVQSQDQYSRAQVGQPMLWTIEDEPKMMALNYTYKDRAVTWQHASRCFFNVEQNQLYVPTTYYAETNPQRITLLVDLKKSFDGDRPSVPGFAIPQAGPDQTCISFDFEFGRESNHGIVYFSNPVSGKVARRVTVSGLPDQLEKLFEFHTQRYMEFVPGRELLIWIDPQEDGVVYIAACAAPTK